MRGGTYVDKEGSFSLPISSDLAHLEVLGGQEKD